MDPLIAWPYGYTPYITGRNTYLKNRFIFIVLLDYLPSSIIVSPIVGSRGCSEVELAEVLFVSRASARKFICINSSMIGL